MAQKIKQRTMEPLKLHTTFKERIVSFMIKYKLFQHKNKFKVGDVVTYNWKAKAYISSAIKDEVLPKKVISQTFGSLDFSDGQSADPFWMRKLNWAESIDYIFDNTPEQYEE